MREGGSKMRWGWVIVVMGLLLSVCGAVDMRMVPGLGDARMGVVAGQEDVGWVQYKVVPPPGAHKGLTVVAWMRLTKYGNAQLTTQAFWCPEEVDRWSADKLGGAGGHGGAELDLTAAGGVVVVPGVVMVGYETDDGRALNTLGEYGVATVAGESEQVITVSVGGEDVIVGPGEFNKNVKAGPSGSVVISGGGRCRVGVSQTPMYKFYHEIDGVIRTDGLRGITPESTITNEWAMVSWRWRCDEGGTVYRSDIGRLHAFDDLAVTTTNEACEVLHSGGIYRVGLTGLQNDPPYDVELFDGRVFGRWLEQEEMERIHANGVEELIRRGLVE